MQGLPSLQICGAVPWQTPPLHVSPSEQASPSLQGSVLTVCVQSPAGSQASVVHGLPSSAHGTVLLTCWQPAAQVSVVHGLPSSHTLLLAALTQPLAGSQLSSVHGLLSLQTFVLPLAQRVPYSDEAYARMAKVQPAAKPEVKPEPTAPEVKPDGKPEAPRGDGEVDWAWPTAGKVIGNFNDGSNKGVVIAGKMGQPVQASAAGRVIFSGTGIRGLGKLVVIRHNANYLSVYAHNDNLLVKEGQTVRKGQRIADMGSSDADQVKLHFEIRRQGKPVDPAKLLPGT